MKLSFSLWFFLLIGGLTLSLHAQDPVTKSWVITLILTHGQDAPQERHFGVHPSGTDGFDIELDTLSPPPPIAWFSYFVIDAFPHLLSTDIRSSNVEIRDRSLDNAWLLKIDNARDIPTCISWSAETLPAGTYDGGILEMRDETDQILVDMLQDTTWIVEGDQTLYFHYEIPKDITDVGKDTWSDLSNFVILGSNYPNPFNHRTVIPLSLRYAMPVHLGIFSLRGRCICTLVDGVLTAGFYKMSWEGYDDQGMRMPSGLYFARLIADCESQIIKLILAE